MDKTTINKPTLRKKHNVLNKLSYIALGILLLGTSCTKEEERWTDEPYSKLADNRFISYRVANAIMGDEQPIYSSIDNDKKTITVFLPHYYVLQTMEVEAELPDGATISPALNELVPVFPEDGKDFTYEVSGKSGEKATYTVKVVIQQPSFILKEISTETNIKTIGSGNIQINGRDFVPGASVMKVSLLDEDGKLAVPQTAFEVRAVSARESKLFCKVAEDKKESIETGKKYWIEVQNYAVKARMKYPIYLSK